MDPAPKPAAGPRFRPITLEERRSLETAGVRITLLRINSDGSILLGVASSEPIEFVRQRLPPRPPLRLQTRRRRR